MARRLIGLDIGTNAVTVTEVEVGNPATLRVFGQVALPRDVMREGEIVDVEVVASAIRRLWREVGLKKGAVRVGIGTPRLIVRPVELPEMNEADLAGALQFQAQDLIPIPLDDAYFDFQVLGAGIDPEGNATTRVLLAAAPRETITRIVAAVESAGLSVEAVDLVPLALVRSLATPVDPGAEPSAEAIVCVGAGVTVVVVHESGSPRFARVLGSGGRALTEAIATDLDLAFEAAEALKRQGINTDDEIGARARSAIEGPLNSLLEDVRSSLEFYRAQSGGAEVKSVLLNGGGSQLVGLADRLETVLGLPVTRAHCRSRLAIGDIGFAPDEYEMLDPYLSVPVGLAFGATSTGRAIDLSPPKDRGAADRRKLVAVVVVIALLLLGGLGFLTASQRTKRSDQQALLDQERDTNAAVQAKIDELATFEAQQAQIDVIQGQIAALLATDVSWSRLLEDIAMKMPQNDWLSSFQGTVTAAAPAAPAPVAPAPSDEGSTSTTGTTSTTVPAVPAPAAAGLSGTVSMTLTGRDFTDVSQWLLRMAEIPSLTDVWVPTSTKSVSDGGSQQTVSFSSTAKITPQAKATRSELRQKLKVGQ